MIVWMLLAQAAAAQAPLELVCGGGGTANKAVYGTADSYTTGSGNIGGVGYMGSSNTTTTLSGVRQQGFVDQVDVKLFAGDDRIRLPNTMLPLIRGGSEGWFKLKNVQVTERAITASAAVNLINNPKVRIDRVTGVISISGKGGDYVGQCERLDTQAPRKF